jgi:hypothetical protein
VKPKKRRINASNDSMVNRIGEIRNTSKRNEAINKTSACGDKSERIEERGALRLTRFRDRCEATVFIHT